MFKPPKSQWKKNWFWRLLWKFQSIPLTYWLSGLAGPPSTFVNEKLLGKQFQNNFFFHIFFFHFENSTKKKNKKHLQRQLKNTTWSSSFFGSVANVATLTLPLMTFSILKCLLVSVVSPSSSSVARAKGGPWCRNRQ